MDVLSHLENNLLITTFGGICLFWYLVLGLNSRLLT